MESAKKYFKVKNDVEAIKKMVDWFKGATVVTQNQRDFEAIREIKGFSLQIVS